MGEWKAFILEFAKATGIIRLMDFLYERESDLRRRCRNAKILRKILLLEWSKLEVFRHPSIVYKLRRLNEIDGKIISLFEEIEGIG